MKIKVKKKQAKAYKQRRKEYADMRAQLVTMTKSYTLTDSEKLQAINLILQLEQKHSIKGPCTD